MSPLHSSAAPRSLGCSAKNTGEEEAALANHEQPAGFAMPC